MTPSQPNDADKYQERIAELELKNGLLREELWDQWEVNHCEHCDREWPHSEGRMCHWPLPDALGDCQ